MVRNAAVGLWSGLSASFAALTGLLLVVLVAGGCIFLMFALAANGHMDGCAPEFAAALGAVFWSAVATAGCSLLTGLCGLVAAFLPGPRPVPVAVTVTPVRRARPRAPRGRLLSYRPAR